MWHLCRNARANTPFLKVPGYQENQVKWGNYLCWYSSVYQSAEVFRKRVSFIKSFILQAFTSFPGKSPWTCKTESGHECVLPFVDGTLSYRTCTSTSSSNGNGWCPTKAKWTHGGESSYSGGDYGWDFCDPKDAYLELKKEKPFGCTYGKGQKPNKMIKPS